MNRSPLFSLAFMRGFWAGLSGPSRFARRLSLHRHLRFSADVGLAWHRVGRVLEHTMNADQGRAFENAKHKSAERAA